MKKILIYSLLLSSGLAVSARTLGPAEALSRATGQTMSRSAGDITPVMTVGTADAPTLYVFNRPDEGWMIVSADDVAAPLIGYSDTGSFDPDNLPDNFKGWIEMCDEQISRASAAGAVAYTAVERTDDKSPIEPLTKTKWNQSTPYNKYCPTGTVTGCVATAMGQVMKYYNWPETAGANASFSYKWGDTTLAADFSNYKFDWDNMLDVYNYSGNDAQAEEAVAKLMQACGYSLNMRYASEQYGGSAAFSENVGTALGTYFGYDKGLHNEYLALHTSAEWEDMVYDNLQNVGPMVYWGGAHCFVCDGYSENGYFHFNWGWGGRSDGYFLLNALAPGMGGIGSGTGDYTMRQGALFGAKPSTGADSPKQYTFRIDELTDATVSGIMLTLTGTFATNSTFAATGKVVYQIYDIDGKEKVATYNTYTYPSNWVYGGTYGQLKGNITNIPDGSYRVYPAVEVDGVEWQFQSPATVKGYVLLTVANGKLSSVEIPSAGELIVENLTLYGDFYEKSKIKFSGLAKFSGSGDIAVTVLPCLMRADGSVRARSTSQLTLNFTAEGTPFEFTLPWFQNDNSKAVEPGDYFFSIAIIENGNYKALGSCPVKVHEQNVSPKFDISVEIENANSVNPDDIKILATITGTSGLYDEYISFQLYRADTSTSIMEMPDIYVTEGQTVTIELHMSLPGAVAGEIYNLKTRNYRWVTILDPIYFTIGSKSGIDSIGADNDAPVEYFNLQGQPVSGDSLNPGIYIRRQGNKVTKVLIK